LLNGVPALQSQTSLNNYYSGGAGNLTGTGGYNTANGFQALYSNTTGSGNSAQGYQALFSNTTGSGNSAQGDYALFSNTTGNYNSAQGGYALFSNTTGNANSAQGYNALNSNTTGSANSANGFDALNSNTTGTSNSAQGYGAGQFISDGSTANTTSSNSVYLGANTEAKADGDTNENVIGNAAIGYGSNTTTLGSPSIIELVAFGTGDGCLSSTSGVITGSGLACGSGGGGTVTTTGSPVSPNIAAFSSSMAITTATSANIQTAIGAGVYDASGAAAARQANLSLLPGTYTNGDMCTYASSGTLLNCNTAVPSVGTWGALNYPTWVSGTPFVKMTAAGTFSLDTNTYLTTAGGTLTGALNGTSASFSGTVAAGALIPTGLTAGTSPVCANGTAGALTNVGCAGGGGGTPGGSTTQVQYNNAGTFAANANLTTDGNGNLTAAGNVSAGTTTPTTIGSSGVLLNGVPALQSQTSLNNYYSGGAGNLTGTGSNNTANGLYALNSNTTGNSNSAQGYVALYSNTTGNNNSAQGYTALGSNTTGYDNSAQGYGALYYNTTGNNNTANGFEAGQYIADGVTPNQTSSSSVYEGYEAYPLVNGDTNENVIGNTAIGHGSNTTTLGNTTTVGTWLNGTQHITATAPITSAGTIAAYSTNAGGAITSLSAATTVTITFANSGWTNAAFCVATPSVSLATAPYVSAISPTAVTFTFVALTGNLYYHCDGN
jgi:hypothetical protein